MGERNEFNIIEQKRRKRNICLSVAGIMAFSFCLRAPITSVGPLVTTIGAELHVSNSLMGLITTLPVLTFGLLSPLVSRLSHKMGASNTIAAGLFFIAAGGFIRSFLGIPGLWVGTALVGMGICVGNVLIPSIIKHRFPGRVGLLTSVYTTTMGFIASIGAGLSVPLSQGLGLGWKLTLVFWSVIAFFAAFLWIPKVEDETPGKLSQGGGSLNAPQEGLKNASNTLNASNGLKPLNALDTSRTSEISDASNALRTSDIPEASNALNASNVAEPEKGAYSYLWRSKTAWYMTLFMGFQSLLFYAVTSWMPTIVQSQGLSQQTAGTMALLFQLVGLPITFLTPILTERLKRQEFLVILMGLLYIGGLLPLVLAPGQLLPVTVGIILMSICACGAFAWAMATIGLRATSGGETAVLSGMVQSVGYLLAAVGPLLSGVIFDLLGSWNWTLLFYFIAALGMMLFGVLAARRKSL